MMCTVVYSTRDIDSHASYIFFFLTGTATTELYTLSLHDALPILNLTDGLDGLAAGLTAILAGTFAAFAYVFGRIDWTRDRKSTRLNSSHTVISYAVFCLKKKTKSRRRSCSPVHSGSASITERTPL